MAERTKKRTTDRVEITPEMRTAYVMFNMGWKGTHLAEVFNRSSATITRWMQTVEDSDEFAPETLISARLASDRLQGMIPQALDIYQSILEQGAKHPKALDTATNVLKTFKVVIDRLAIAPDQNADDDELIAEAERIISGAKGQAQRDNG